MAFLEEDKQQFKDELVCYKYCIRKSEEAASTGNYGEAAAYLENSLRSLRELQRLTTKKQQQEKIHDLVVHLNSEQVQIVISKMK